VTHTSGHAWSPSVQLVPTLVFGWGNPSRGDDALGPTFIERAAKALSREAAHQVEFLTDFQLQVEHALDLVGRHRVLFVDAARASSIQAFSVKTAHACQDIGYTSHALSPEFLLAVCNRVSGGRAPSATVLAIHGTEFDLGAPLSAEGEAHLGEALRWFVGWVMEGTERC
jgi:hydrogenase maturation protease